MPITSILPKGFTAPIKNALAIVPRNNQGVQKTSLPALSGGSPRAFDERPYNPKNFNDFSGVNDKSHYLTGGRHKAPNYKELYLIAVCSDLVVSSCSAIADSLRGLSWRVETSPLTRDEWKALPGHPVEQILKRPNPKMNTHDISEQWVWSLYVYGILHALKIRRNQVAARQIDFTKEDSPVCGLFPVCAWELEPIHVTRENMGKIQPDVKNREYINLFFIQNPRVEVWSGYIYTKKENRKKFLLTRENLVDDPMFNLEKPGIGLSPVQVMARWINQDFAMSHLNLSVFDNHGMSDTYFFLKNTQGQSLEMVKERLEMMKEKYAENYARSGKAPGAPVFLSGDVDIKQLAIEMDKLAIDEAFDRVEARVNAAFGGAVQWLVNLKHATNRATAETLDRAFYKRTIFPLLTRIREKLESDVLDAFTRPGERLRLIPVTDNMPVASFIRTEETERAEGLFTGGLIRRDEGRAETGYPALGGKEGDFLVDPKQPAVKELTE